MKPVPMTKVEAWHLLTLLKDNERDGSYYGPKGQWWDRTRRLIARLEAALAQQT